MALSNATRWTGTVPVMLMLFFLPGAPTAQAHCDGMDGPVVKSARLALDSNQVERALMWVPDADTDAVRRAFLRARSVRGLGDEAQIVADTYFFETVVRLHRAAEGAPFTGLAPAGRDLGPAIPAADRALRSGNLAPLHALLETAYRKRLDSTFRTVRERQHHSPNDVHGGREFVASYVEFIHYVERLYEAAAEPAEGHYREPEETLLGED